MGLHRIALALVFVLPTACGTLPNGRGWGQDATLLPGWERIGQAFVGAALDPWTWVPLAGAAALQIGNADEDISDWAADQNPIFGSEDSAKDVRKYTGNAILIAYGITALATPSGETAGEWIPAKLKGAAVGGSAQFLTISASNALKSAVGRTRPNDENDKSFPSEHASRLGVSATLASRNLDSIEMNDSLRTASRVGLGAICAVGSWSRIEARAHYPSDVLAGLALGHFIGAFLQDAFLGLDQDVSLSVAPMDGGVQVQFGWRF